MIVLLLTILLLLLAACALFLLAGVRHQGDNRADRDRLNLAFYHQRLRELEEDEGQGVVAERPQMVRELQETLLLDIPQTAPKPARQVSRWVLLPGVMILLLVSLVFYVKTGGLHQVRAWQRAKNELPVLRAQVMDPQARPLSMEQLTRLALGIRSELERTPHNVEKWKMLGRLGMVLNNASMASQAFRHALQLAPGDVDVRLSYAEVQTRSNDPQDNREALMMLETMAIQYPANVRVLGLLAFNAYNQQDFARAAETWQKMLPMIAKNAPRRVIIQRSIQQAESASGKEKSHLALTISLSPEVEKMLPANGVLYISVSDGVSQVPVAVKKSPLSHFPLSLTLDDSDARMPDRLLSSQHQVQVSVRISRDGSAYRFPGDWYGVSDVLPFAGQQQLAVEINRQ